MELEGKVDLGSSETIKGNEVPGSYDVEANTEENPPSQFSNSVVGPIAPVAELAVVPVVSAPPAEPAVVATPVANGVVPDAEPKKKRGRPRKYGLDGKPLALSPMPISASIPLTGKLLTWKPSKAKPIDLFKKKHKLEFQSPGSQVAYSAGSNFTPHLITVNAGEDVSMKIMTFAQQGSRVICILSANGSISNVTLRQPNSSGGTLTYEGRFEILSLSGSFKPTDSGGTKSRTGGMSVSLAGPDGRVLGGGLAGLLVAAGLVQVVIGSFLPGYQQEDNPKRQKSEVGAAFTPSPLNHTSGPGAEVVFSTSQQSFTPVPYHGTNLSFGDPMGTEKTVLTEGPKDLGQTKFVITQIF